MVAGQEVLYKRLEFDGAAAVVLNAVKRQARNDFLKGIDSGRIELIPRKACLCGNKEFKRISAKDRLGLPFENLMCMHCGLFNLNPQIAPGSLPAYYRDLYYSLISGTRPGALLEVFVRKEQGKFIYDFVKGCLSKDNIRVCEIGCAGGLNLEGFAKAAENDRIRTDMYGCEYEEHYVSQARHKGFRVAPGGVESLLTFGVKFDLIILSHVLEHFSDPHDELRKIRDLLGEDGLLYVEVPGIMNLPLYGNDLGACLVHAHNYSFNLSSLTYILSLNGFSLLGGNETVQALFRYASNSSVAAFSGGNSATILDYLKSREAIFQDGLGFMKKVKRSIRHLCGKVEYRIFWKKYTTKILSMTSPSRSRSPRKKVSRLIFIAEQGLDQYNYKRLGIDILKSNGFDVEYWDITPILHPKGPAAPLISVSYTDVAVTTFADKKEFYKKLGSLTDGSFILNIIGYFPDIRYISFFRGLWKSVAGYATFIAAAVPESRDAGVRERSAGRAAEFVKKVLSISPWDIPGKAFRSIISRVPFAILGLRPPTILLTAGDNCMKYRWPIGKETDIVKAHAWDYDRYLEERNKNTHSRPIAVFLDVYLPFHPEWTSFKYDPMIKPDRYFQLLDGVFTAIEKELKLEVVIAAHPRSDYDRMPDYFKGRRRVKGETASLVRTASLVLTHCSTAVNFATLFHKPISFLMFAEADKTPIGTVIRAMASMHGKKPIDIDKECAVDWRGELAVNEEAYDAYRRSYIKSDGSQDIPFWQILADRVKEL